MKINEYSNIKKTLTYSIGITTYSYRFEKYLVPLVEQIRKFTPNELIIGINGDYKVDFDEKYRKEVLQMCSKYKKVFPFLYPQFRSLSKIWNNISINASNNYVLIMNDDTVVKSRDFFTAVQYNLEKYRCSFTMNAETDHFAYFVISRDELERIGWFDERFLGIGWEDLEFKRRYRSIIGKDILNVERILGIETFFDKENCVVNQKVGQGKYSKFNHLIHDRFLPAIPQYPHERFFWENYDKL